MKILETALICPLPEYLEELASGLALEKQSVLDIEVYRYEIDEEFAILLYDLSAREKISPEALEHLSPHLSALLIVTDNEVEDLPAEVSGFIEEFAWNLEQVPTLLALRTDREKLQSLNPHILQSGFYLSERGRVLFWHPKQRDTRQRVWGTLWETLQELSV